MPHAHSCLVCRARARTHRTHHAQTTHHHIMSTIRSFGASFMSRVGQLASSISSTASEMRPSLFDAPASNALDFESDSDDDGYGATPPSRQQEQQQPTPPPTGGGGPTKPARGRPSKLGRSKTVNFRGSRNRDKEVAVALDEVYSQNPAPIPMRQSMVYRTKNWHDDVSKPRTPHAGVRMWACFGRAWWIECSCVCDGSPHPLTSLTHPVHRKTNRRWRSHST